MPKIAFIGLGNMGAPMVQHLAKRGYKVKAYDISATARDAVANAGVKVCDTINDAVSDAKMVVSMLSASEHVRSLYLGGSEEEQQGVFSLLAKGTLVIDCSTIAVQEAQNLAAHAKNLGLRFVDAPVSGSIAGAQAARLTFMVGGSREAFSKAKPVLLNMGNTVFHAGESGAGQGAKICNNMMLGILMSGSAEVLNLGQKTGVDPVILTDIMIRSSGRNWALEVYNPYPKVALRVPASNQYTGGFSSNNMYNDLSLALEVADAAEVKIPMGKRATKIYKEHAVDYGEKDFSSIMVQYDPSVLDS